MEHLLGLEEVKNIKNYLGCTYNAFTVSDIILSSWHKFHEKSITDYEKWQSIKPDLCGLLEAN
ncbi:MAG: hypothetical protein MRQ09_01330 [Candidatus Midichloria sp.]|nr:hypothetical protein [Candidatus Midichloria sp.]